MGPGHHIPPIPQRMTIPATPTQPIRHRLMRVALGAALVLACFAATASADAAADSTAAGRLAELRAARKTAWLHRMAGDADLARDVADRALEEVEAEIASDPDAATRRELNDLRASLTGLRDAAAHDLAKLTQGDDGNGGDPSMQIEPQMNPDVLKWVDYFTGRGRPTFERWLRRSGRYADLFRTVLEREGLPPDLVHLVFVESGFNLEARSRSAAVGPWQFMRSTARLFGLTVNQWVDERKDPEKSTVAAARYLRHLYSIFNDWPLALASYNAGEGTVIRAIRRQGTTNYWDLRLPRQTEDYVPQFMAVLAISRDPARYGFDSVELEDPMGFDEVVLSGAVDLNALAKMLDCNVTELRRLNPALNRNAARGRDGVTALRVPEGKGELLNRRLQEGAAEPASDMVLTHRVRRGETLSGIAAKYRLSTQRLAAANGIKVNGMLKVGQVLDVTANFGPPAVAEIAPDDPRGSTAYVPKANVRPLTPVPARSDASGRYTVTVKRGQTLGAIAQANGVSVADLKRWNRLTSNRVRRGQRLKIRKGDDDATTDAADGSDDAVASAAPAEKTEVAKAGMTKPAAKSKATSRITVQRGDTLSTLARRHGVSVRALKRANGLRSDRIRVGQKLNLPTS